MGPDLTAVVGVLGDAAAYPAGGFSQSARAMLVDGLAHALPGAGQVHAFQAEFLKCTGEGFSAAKATAAAEAQASREAIRAAEAQLSAARASHEAALKSLEEARAEVEAKEESHRLTALDLKTAEAEHAGAEQVERGLVERRREIEGRKGAADAVLAQVREFEAAEELAGFDTEAVSQYLAVAGVEKALIAAARAALLVPKSRRNDFDALTWAEASKVVEGGAVAVDAELAAAATKATCATSEALGLWAISDEAGDATMEAAVALSGAKRAGKQASVAVSAAEAEVKKRKEDAAALDDEQAAVERKARKIDEAYAAFERLRCPQEEAPQPPAPSPAKPAKPAKPQEEEQAPQPPAPSPAKPQEEEAPQPPAPSPARPDSA